MVQNLRNFRSFKENAIRVYDVIFTLNAIGQLHFSRNAIVIFSPPMTILFHATYVSIYKSYVFNCRLKLCY